MNKKRKWTEIQAVLDQNGITKLYHFTDRDNLESIIQNGGLYSWKDCEDKGITIPKPGGDQLSRQLDERTNLQNFVRISFVRHHPMMYAALNEDRISNPVVLEINPEVILWKDSQYADRNATRKEAKIGNDLDHLKAIHFDAVKARQQFDLDDDEQMFFQAEILVKNHIPLEYITNIRDFGIAIPSKPQQIQSKKAYTAQISRANPTAFIFAIDQSASMGRTVNLLGEEVTMAEAVKRIVNRQLYNLVLRCVRGNETRHYYDIAILGYGANTYPIWEGDLKDREFVSPEELQKNPFKRITTRKEVKTRKGTSIKETEELQWIESRHDGRQTRMDLVLKQAKELAEKWISQHPNSYPPTIIHITDGEFVGTTRENVMQQVNEIKSMFTTDGNVLLFNIHVTPDHSTSLKFPIDRNEVRGNEYSTLLYDMSSLLPFRYNEDISKVRNDNADERHVAMAVNADMSLLIQLMDIGTPTPTTK